MSKDSTQSDMKESDFDIDMDEDDLLDEDGLVQVAEDGQDAGLEFDKLDNNRFAPLMDGGACDSDSGAAVFDLGHGINDSGGRVQEVQTVQMVGAPITAVVGASFQGDGADSNINPVNSKAPLLVLSPRVVINELKETRGARDAWVAGTPVKKKHTDQTTPNAASASASSPLWRSLRRAGSVDEDSLDQASRLVAKRNLENLEGTPFDNSIINFSSRQITDNF